MSSPNEEAEHLEKLNTRLYSKDNMPATNHPGTLHAHKSKTPEDWQAADPKDANIFVPMKNKPRSSFKTFFIFSIIFLGISLLFAGYMFFVKGMTTVSNDDIEINVLGNAFTPGGEPLPLQIEMRNKNSTALEYVDLLLEYPKGTEASAPGDFVRLRNSVGTIAAGQTVTNNMNITLYGEQGTTKELRLTLEYRVPGSNAIYTKERTFLVNISSVPVSLSIDMPKSISSNQEIVLNVKAVLNSKNNPPNLILKMEYPTGFRFIEATPKTQTGTTIWSMDDLQQGKEKTIQIRGILQAQEGEERTFHAYLGEQNPRENTGISTIYTSLLQTVAIERPFLEARLALNGDNRDVIIADPDKTISGAISWNNNLSEKVLDGVIVAKIEGEIVDEASIRTTRGFYNSQTNEVIWDSNTNQDFAQIDPGANGVVQFSFKPLPLVNGTTVRSNPEISISVSIRGKQASTGNAVSAVDAFEKKVIRFASVMGLKMNAMYANGPFDNTGPVPPQAEKKTTYTIKWELTNAANALEGVEVRGTLPTYVTFTDLVSPGEADISYNSSNHEVIWKVPKLDRGVGILEAAKAVHFQVALTPSLSQVDSIPALITNVKATAQDTYTKSMVTADAGQVTTVLTSDNSGKGGKVTQ